MNAAIDAQSASSVAALAAQTRRRAVASVLHAASSPSAWSAPARPKQSIDGLRASEFPWYARRSRTLHWQNLYGARKRHGDDRRLPRDSRRTTTTASKRASILLLRRTRAREKAAALPARIETPAAAPAAARRARHARCRAARARVGRARVGRAARATPARGAACTRNQARGARQDESEDDGDESDDDAVPLAPDR